MQPQSITISSPTPPTDLEQMRTAFRLGWAVAELRGRYRPDLFLHPEAGAPTAFKRDKDEHPLPLGNERKNREVRIEVFQGAAGLSKALNLDLEIDGANALERIRDVVACLEDTDAATRRARWPKVADAFYSWDAQLQDALVVPAISAAAYQLGRALGDTYWALDPERSEQEMSSWGFLFGSHRQQTLERLIARLSAYLGPLVTIALEESFKAWNELAADATRRSEEDVRAALYRQGLLWRDLIRGERQPLDLAPLTATDAWRQISVYRKAFETLKVPLIVGAVFAALLAVAGALLASGAAYPGLTSAFAVLGALGITSAGLYARSKAELISLLTNLRLAVDKQRVRQAANLCPRESAPADAPAKNARTASLLPRSSPPQPPPPASESVRPAAVSRVGSTEGAQTTEDPILDRIAAIALPSFEVSRQTTLSGAGVVFDALLASQRPGERDIVVEIEHVRAPVDLFSGSLVSAAAAKLLSYSPETDRQALLWLIVVSEEPLATLDMEPFSAADLPYGNTVSVTVIDADRIEHLAFPNRRPDGRTWGTLFTRARLK